MWDKTLLKISFAISIIGIFLLLILLNSQTPKLISIKEAKEVNELSINKNLQTQGNIINIKNYNNFQILILQDKTGKIQVLIDNDLITKLKINQSIVVAGRLTEYEQRLQIKADKIIQ
jgi:aspartyl/asparaginyl-tRNA synthetase